MLFFLLSLITSQEETYLYVGTDPERNGTGATFDDPIGCTVEKILEGINSICKSPTCIVHFTPGFHYVKHGGIMGWFYNQDIVQKIIFEGEEGKTTVIHGGKKVSGWKKSDTYENIWTLDYKDPVHSFYVNDQRANFARIPSNWEYAQIKSYEVENDPDNDSLVIRHIGVQKECIDFLKKHDNKSMREVELMLYHTWYQDKMKIESIDEENNIVTCKNSRELEELLYSEFSRPRTTDYYYLQNSIYALTKPGEYYHDKEKGILYYYPHEGIDMTTAETYMAVEEYCFSFNGIRDCEFRNLEFRYTTDATISGQVFQKLWIHDCTFRLTEIGLGFLTVNHTLVEHCLFEDTGGAALGLNGMRCNSGIHNCIIRGYGKRVFAQGFNYWGENNDTFVTNCDISDGVQTPLQYGDGAAWNASLRQNTYIAHNHIHHYGYRIADDIGGIFFGSHPTGNVMDHNCIHDVCVHNYCGQGIVSDTGSNGAVVKNNLVYDIEHTCWGMNGMHHQCYNNIFAFSTNKIGFGEIDINEEVMTAHHNICYNGPNDADFLTGAYNNDVKIQFYNNLYFSEVDDYKFF